MIRTLSDARRAYIWRADLGLIACLIALGVVARVLPHAPNVMPVAASGLFAACVLRRRALAPLVPLAAMFLSDAVLGFSDWRVTAVVYVALALPAAAALLPARWRKSVVLIPLVVSGSLVFFAASNFAVWAFSGMYTPDLQGLISCYVAALPFLQNTIAGDLFWAAALFGGYWLARIAPIRLRSFMRGTA